MLQGELPLARKLPLAPSLAPEVRGEVDRRVGEADAWWIAGGDHFFFYRDAQGNVVDTTLRLADNTLIWEEAGVTHRVEGAPSLAAAIRVAESLE